MFLVPELFYACHHNKIYLCLTHIYNILFDPSPLLLFRVFRGGGVVNLGLGYFHTSEPVSQD